MRIAEGTGEQERQGTVLCLTEYIFFSSVRLGAKRPRRGVVIQSLPRPRLCYAVVVLTGGGFPFHFITFCSTCCVFSATPPATLPS